MRRAILAVLALCAATASAQVNYYPSRAGTGSADPSQFSSSAGTLSIGGSVGAVTLDADTTIVPLYSTGTSDPATCTAGGMFHLRTDSSLLKSCVATDTWLQLYTITDDSVLVGTGTTTASKAIADCDDTGGNHLNYDTATNAFSCGTSGANSTFDPSVALTVYCEFINGLTTGGNAGECAALPSAISSGTYSTVAASANNPGLVRLNSHATNDNSGEQILFHNGIGAPVNTSTWTAATWSIDAVVIVGSNSTAITNSALYVGLAATITTDPATLGGGIWIRRDSDRSDTNFVFAVCNSAVTGCGSAGDDTAQKTAASTITPSAGTAYRFRISQDFTGPGSSRKISMRVNNETAKTFCSSTCDDTLDTVSAASWFPMVTYLTRTTTGVLSSDVDYLYLTITGLTRY